MDRRWTPIDFPTPEIHNKKIKTQKDKKKTKRGFFYDTLFHDSSRCPCLLIKKIEK